MKPAEALTELHLQLAELECLGHEPDPEDGANHGRTVYCDGSCRAGRGSPRAKLLSALRGALLRDWVVRVLDARFADGWRVVPEQAANGVPCRQVSGEPLRDSAIPMVERYGSEMSQCDAARLEAALAVWPELTDEQRSNIGGQP